MNKLITALAISALITTPAIADQDQQHGKGQNMQGNMMMNMMSHDQMMAMHKHMQSMRETMKKIKNEDDPDKRKKLMQEHMEEMQKGMHMMNQGMSKDMNMGALLS